MTTVTERVAAGAALMDETDPGWWRADVDRAINLAKLNMEYGDRCILGQRCPLEVLTAFIGEAPRDEDDNELKYHAYAGKLMGAARCDVNLEDWAVAHGFNKPFRAEGMEYTALEAEWTLVISARREAATTAGGEGQ